MVAAWVPSQAYDTVSVSGAGNGARMCANDNVAKHKACVGAGVG